MNTLLQETNTLTNVRLSDTQKMLMSKVKGAANSTVAAEQSYNDPNMASAQKTLIKLDLLSSSSGLSITPKGLRIMTTENLTDDTGELTDEGRQFADATDLADLQKAKSSDNTPVKPDVDGDGVGDEPLTDTPITECMALFKDVNAMANVQALS